MKILNNIDIDVIELMILDKAGDLILDDEEDEKNRRQDILVLMDLFSKLEREKNEV